MKDVILACLAVPILPGITPMKSREFASLQWRLEHARSEDEIAACLPDPCRPILHRLEEAEMRLRGWGDEGIEIIVDVPPWRFGGTISMRRWSHLGLPLCKRFCTVREPPTGLFACGDASMERGPFYAVAGSRNASEEALRVAREFGAWVNGKGGVLVSGGARGVDREATAAAERAVVLAAGPLPVQWAKESPGRLALSENGPDSAFTVYRAMKRNRLIYGLGKFAFVVASDEGRGGTWAGAVEAMEHAICSVAVWVGRGAGPGNVALVKRGAFAVSSLDDLAGMPWFAKRSGGQLNLFEIDQAGKMTSEGEGTET